MSIYNVSSRYAKALVEISLEKGNFEKIGEDVELIYNSLNGSKELRSVLGSPIIREEKKISILDEIFQSHVSPEIMNFMKFIVSKKREDMLIDIMRRFIDLKNDRMNILEVMVESSSDLSVEQKKSMEENLKSKTGKDVKLSFKTDENIIGGFRLRLKDTVIDASVKHQLELLRKSFLGEKLISTN